MARTREYDEKAVIELARDLFWEQGYTATSVQDLEKALGISRSSIYASFGSKRGLYDKTLTAYQHEKMSRLRELLDNTDNLREVLSTLFASTARQSDSRCQSSARGCYVVNATTEMANACPEALGFVAANREQFVAIMADALARAQEQGKLDGRADPAELANYLFVNYSGLQVVVQTNIEREDLVRAVKRTIEALPWT